MNLSKVLKLPYHRLQREKQTEIELHWLKIVIINKVKNTSQLYSQIFNNHKN